MTHTSSTRIRLCALLAAVAVGASLRPAGIPVAHAAPALPPVTVTGVAADNSSVTIDFNPVPGAADYRVFDTASPMTVKYAGMVHLDAGVDFHFMMQPDGVTPVFPYTTAVNIKSTGPQTLTLPGTQIQWNMVDDGLPHTLVVQAVNQLGPTPPGNLTDYANNPINSPAGMVGSNDGPTPDGRISINGQGPPSDNPQVIAQSAPFVVQANSAFRALPSEPNALQTFFDTFDSSEASSLAQVGTADSYTGVMTYTLDNGRPNGWDILFQGADTDHSMPMIDAGHFMDVLFDGVTPSSVPPSYSNLYHTSYSSMSLSPQPTADLSNGNLLHMTAEVDSHMADLDRWLAWQIAPATDPITNFRDDNAITTGGMPSANTLPVNHSDQALWFQLFPNACDAMLFEGPTSSSNAAPITNQFVAPPGSDPGCNNAGYFGPGGKALDDRTRFDLFLTRQHIAVFENGQLLIQSDIPDGGLPFSQAKVYFTHYAYATAPRFEGAQLTESAPWETYWLNEFPNSDERHWDNMGFEVLPSSDIPSDWSTLSSLIHMPVSVPLAPPRITSLSAVSGTTDGGSQVIITGTNFTSASAVSFGPAAAASFNVISSSEIEATTPAESPGTVDVAVTTPAGTSSAVPADRYRFVIPVPAIKSVSPNTGTTSGGTTVLIDGSDLSGATGVSFSGVPAQSFSVISPTQVQAVSPAHLTGQVDVSVRTAGGTSATVNGDHFWYIPAQPTISALSPVSGPAGGGTTVIITGSNLFGATKVLFDGTAAARVTINSPTQLTVVTPSTKYPHTASVAVLTAGGVSAPSPAAQFTYTS